MGFKRIFERVWIRRTLPYKLSSFLNDKNVARYIRDAKNDSLINKRMFEKTGYTHADIDPLGIVLYAVVRSLKPKTVIETGVQSGISSLYILRAIQANGWGVLESIDLPDRPIERVGEVVPNDMREKWHLHIGDSKSLLPKILDAIDSLDLFVHDSLHTYEHMTFEFENCYEYMGKGGIIVSHDILSNEAFDDFCRKYGLYGLKLYNIGIIKI